jgi:thioesterase domain-containing protein/acyl carrier protein
MTSQASPLQEDYLRTELLDIWRPLLNSVALGVDDDFFEMGGDSLLATEMVLEVERRLGIAIPGSLLFEASTVRQLAQRYAHSCEIRPKAVFRVSEPTREPPLLFFHGDWTNGGFYLKEFARALGPDLSVVAVAPHGAHGESIPPSIEDMAVERVEAILEFQPRGPFRLGGHCVGGIVALEAARRLVAQGHRVDVVAMIDPVWTAQGEPWPTLAAGIAQNQSEAHPARPLPDVRMSPESVQRYGEALARYAPAPFDVPIAIFASKFDGRPWQQVSADSLLLELPGGHYDLVTSRAGVFAAHLREHLKRLANQTEPRLLEEHA